MILYLVAAVAHGEPVVYLLGGAMDFQRSEAMDSFYRAGSKPPRPGNCSLDWESTDCPRIAVFTSGASSYQAGKDAYYGTKSDNFSYQKIFLAKGLTPRHVSVHVDNYEAAGDISTSEGRRNLDTLLRADLAFFNGGDQSYHARSFLLDNGTCSPLLCPFLQNVSQGRTVVSGTSAGMYLWSSQIHGAGGSAYAYGILYFSGLVGLAQKRVRDGRTGGTGLSDDRNGTRGLQFQQNGGYMPGFRVLDPYILVDTHFDQRSRLLRLIPAATNMGKKLAIGVDENTSLVVRGGRATVVGDNGVFVVDLRQARTGAGRTYSVEGVVLHYLRNGDYFDLARWQPESTRLPFEGSGSQTNSSNINRPYQITALLSGLARQSFNSSYGVVVPQSDFGRVAPQFLFAFSKGPGFRGYRAGGNNVSAFNVGLNVTSLAMDQPLI